MSPDVNPAANAAGTAMVITMADPDRRL